MEKNKDSELENLKNWDTERAEVKIPVKPTRVVVSVSFPRDDFERISKHAALIGKKTSQFIRDTVVEKTNEQNDLVSFAYCSLGLGASWATDIIPPATLVSGFPIEELQSIIATTG